MDYSPGVVLRAGRWPLAAALGSEGTVVEGSSGQLEGNSWAVCKALNSGKMAGRGSWSQTQRHRPLFSILRRWRQEDHGFRSSLRKTVSKNKPEGQLSQTGHRALYHPHIPPGLPPQTSTSAYSCPPPVSTSVTISRVVTDACARQARPFYRTAGPVPPWNKTIKTLPPSASGTHLCPGFGLGYPGPEPPTMPGSPSGLVLEP